MPFTWADFPGGSQDCKESNKTSWLNHHHHCICVIMLLVSAIQQNESTIYMCIHISLLFFIFFWVITEHWVEFPVINSLFALVTYCIHNNADTSIPWRRTWQPTPVFLPGESHGQRAWWATVHSIAKSQTRLKWLSTHICQSQSPNSSHPPPHT